jgi:hypothetical protein
MNSYGEIARTNGIIYEKEIYKMLIELVNISKFIGPITPNTDIKLISNKKVPSIIENKKTTSKSDILIINNGIEYPISIKMSNIGTQLQIISLNNFKYYCDYNNISFNDDIKTVFEKFLGVIEPSEEELINLNSIRNEKSKNKKRYWLNELSSREQLIIELFIFTNKTKLIEFCLKNGMCYDDTYRPKLFILNNSSYTKTNNILFSFIDYMKPWLRKSEKEYQE